MMKSANKMTAVGINAILCLAFFEGGAGKLPFGIQILAVRDKASHISNNRCLSSYGLGRQDHQTQSSGTRQYVTMTTTTADQYISLSCASPKRRYRVNDTVDIQFSVANTSREAVYLVVPKPEDVSSVMRLKDKNDSMYNKDLYIQLKKFQVYEEDFEMPRLVRLAPGEKYVGEAKHKLVYYTPGAKFSVYLTVYYMKEDELIEFERELDALGSKAGADFPASVIKLTSSPIKLSIAP